MSGSSFSGKTTIPISNIERSKSLPLIDDGTKMYRPYAFPQAYDVNGGYMYFNYATPLTYFEYSAKTNGLYRFTYKAYLNFKYTDTKWCDYLEVVYPSGKTGSYPSSDYEIKRLINTSIIQEGKGETKTVLEDTRFKYHTGERYCDRSGGREKYCYGSTVNTGINDFKFEVKLLKTTTAATQTTLNTYSIGRSVKDGGCDDYLTLDVSMVEKTSSGFSNCVFSTVSASSIFTKQMPIMVDTGFIALNQGDRIRLEYDTNWNITSKRGGVASIDINLGHKLGISGQTIESPYYRGIRASTNIIQKNLFFDQSKESLPFKMVRGGNSHTVKMDGTLYLSDKQCGNIKTPTVNSRTFKNLNFVDSSAPNNRLVWNVNQSKPTNKWAHLITSNEIKDYNLYIGDKTSLTKLKQNGVFCFYIPTYNDEYGATCSYTFPSVSQSYIIVNKFKNVFGGILQHFIVITPECKFYKPCTATKPNTVYDVLHKSLPEERRLLNYNKKLNINGKEITVVSNKSHYNPAPLRLPQQQVCKYYCSCGQPKTSSLDILPSTDIPIDSIFGTTNIITDLEAMNCEECFQNATNYCSYLLQSVPNPLLGTQKDCVPFIVGDCETQYVSNQQTRLTKDKGIKATIYIDGISTSIFYVLVEKVAEVVEQLEKVGLLQQDIHQVVVQHLVVVESQIIIDPTRMLVIYVELLRSN